MATQEANLHAKTIEMIEHAQAAELSAANGKWAECSTLAEKMVFGGLAMLLAVNDHDPSLVTLASVNRLCDEMNDLIAAKTDPEDDDTGEEYAGPAL